jgi:hypothetical protein
MQDWLSSRTSSLAFLRTGNRSFPCAEPLSHSLAPKELCVSDSNVRRTLTNQNQPVYRADGFAQSLGKLVPGEEIGEDWGRAIGFFLNHCLFHTTPFSNT